MIIKKYVGNERVNRTKKRTNGLRDRRWTSRRGNGTPPGRRRRLLKKRRRRRCRRRLVSTWVLSPAAELSRQIDSILHSWFYSIFFCSISKLLGFISKNFILKTSFLENVIFWKYVWKKDFYVLIIEVCFCDFWTHWSIFNRTLFQGTVRPTPMSVCPEILSPCPILMSCLTLFPCLFS